MRIGIQKFVVLIGVIGTGFSEFVTYCCSTDYQVETMLQKIRKHVGGIIHTQLHFLHTNSHAGMTRLKNSMSICMKFRY